MSDLQQTHHEECWRQRRHHECAVGKIERQADRIAKLEGVIYRNCDPMAAVDDDAKIIDAIAATEQEDDNE